MTVLTFGVNGPTMQLTVDMQIADTDAPRILAYLASTPYGTVEETVNGVITPRPATTQECAQAFAAGILRGLLDQTVSHERNQAAAAAMATVNSINPI